MHPRVTIISIGFAFATFVELTQVQAQSPCESSPCHAGGICRPLYNENDYECDCPDDTSGKYCQPVACKRVGVPDRDLVPDSTMVASSVSDYLQIDLGSVGSVCAIATQGTMSPFYSTSYKLQYDRRPVFPGNTAQSNIVQNSLSIAIKARYVRFYPVTFHYWPCLRVEIFVQE
ncbi:EGF-like repeat and discoidin I-like domain-containing protein 3 [Montipora capricornis]|uniref:EGF-like repeat and discoidin I-like domain-containing protein 3 n=1 Tax=Montipora capricornis TaxID=246305 RepID=UPI0035F1E596